MFALREVNQGARNVPVLVSGVATERRPLNLTSRVRCNFAGPGPSSFIRRSSLASLLKEAPAPAVPLTRVSLFRKTPLSFQAHRSHTPPHSPIPPKLLTSIVGITSTLQVTFSTTSLVQVRSSIPRSPLVSPLKDALAPSIPSFTAHVELPKVTPIIPIPPVAYPSPSPIPPRPLTQLRPHQLRRCRLKRLPMRTGLDSSRSLQQNQAWLGLRLSLMATP